MKDADGRTGIRLGGIDEGDELRLPCKHCASVSLALKVFGGQREIVCGKCRGTTRIHLRRDPSGFEIGAQGV